MAELHKGVDFVGVTLVYYCHDGAGNFVMALRGKGARDEHGRWELGSGGLEFGETIEDRLRTEVREEYCAEILEFEFLGYLEMHRQQQGRPTHWLALVFKVLVDPSQVRIGEPHKFDNIGWFSLDKLPQPVHSHFPALVERFRAKP